MKCSWFQRIALYWKCKFSEKHGTTSRKKNVRYHLYLQSHRQSSPASENWHKSLSPVKSTNLNFPWPTRFLQAIVSTDWNSLNCFQSITPHFMLFKNWNQSLRYRKMGQTFNTASIRMWIPCSWATLQALRYSSLVPHLVLTVPLWSNSPRSHCYNGKGVNNTEWHNSPNRKRHSHDRSVWQTLSWIHKRLGFMTSQV